MADSVRLAEAEISEVFRKKELPPEKDTDTGLFGDEVGPCPLCGGTVKRTSFGYGCANYREKGCRFSLREVICGRTLSLSMAKLLLTEGRTGLIEGFVSPKSGRSFDAYLKLSEGRAVFEFPDRPTTARPAPQMNGGGYTPPPEVPPYPENPLPDWLKNSKGSSS